MAFLLLLSLYNMLHAHQITPASPPLIRWTPSSQDLLEMIPNEPIMWSTMNYSRNNETLNRLPVPDLRGWNGKRMRNLASD